MRGQRRVPPLQRMDSGQILELGRAPGGVRRAGLAAHPNVLVRVCQDEIPGFII